MSAEVLLGVEIGFPLGFDGAKVGGGGACNDLERHSRLYLGTSITDLHKVHRGAFLGTHSVQF